MAAEATRPTFSPLDLSEKGRGPDGQPVTLNRRLFMQFLAFGDCADAAPLATALSESGIPSALYLDLNDARGIGLLALSEEPDFFVGPLRDLLIQLPFNKLTPKAELTMFGRTYAIGYEADLEDVLLHKPRTKVLNPDLPWAIWYPLRRAKHFETLEESEQQRILGEHGHIGMTFGRSGLATDIRLASHGLDKHDNDFVIGLLGKDLHPLSACVQAMRKTKQTSQHLESLGPFFVGKVLWQSGI